MVVWIKTPFTGHWVFNIKEFKGSSSGAKQLVINCTCLMCQSGI